MPEKLFPKLEGRGRAVICWIRRGSMTCASLDEWWLADRPEEAGYIFVIIFSLFVSWVSTQVYDFACIPKLMGRRTL